MMFKRFYSHETNQTRLKFMFHSHSCIYPILFKQHNFTLFFDRRWWWKWILATTAPETHARLLAALIVRVRIVPRLFLATGPEHEHHTCANQYGKGHPENTSPLLQIGLPYLKKVLNSKILRLLYLICVTYIGRHQSGQTGRNYAGRRTDAIHQSHCGARIVRPQIERIHLQTRIEQAHQRNAERDQGDNGHFITTSIRGGDQQNSRQDGTYADDCVVWWLLGGQVSASSRYSPVHVNHFRAFVTEQRPLLTSQSHSIPEDTDTIHITKNGNAEYSPLSLVENCITSL